MDSVISSTVTLLVAAIIVALIARRLALPYTVGLVIAGVVMALAHMQTGLGLTQGLIYTVILPPLLFESAINLPWPEVRRDAAVIFALAILGTLLAAAVVAAGMVLLLHWPLPAAMLFAVLIAATDPVAVIAMFKDNHVTGRLRLLVECESLFNDGVAAVLFTLVLAWVEAGAQSSGEIVLTLFLTVVGGVAIGAAGAGAAMFLAGRTSDHLVEATLTTVTAYGVFLFAQHVGASGVLAVVTAGLVMGNFGLLEPDDSRGISLAGRQFVTDLWEFIAFIANSLVFLLIGSTVAGLSAPAFGLRAMAGMIVLVLLSRAVTVYPICLGFARSVWRVPMRMQHVLWWGGLRGALGLALALSLPAGMVMRREILFATFGVVVFSVVVQGLTMPVLLKRAQEG
jgi:CPA1 family monovalent cation:H+ antiporter